MEFAVRLSPCGHYLGHICARDTLKVKTPRCRHDEFTLLDPPPTVKVPQADDTPAVQTITRGLRSRSCVWCRTRNIVCDKQVPCSNCMRARIQCLFPAPGESDREALIRLSQEEAPPRRPMFFEKDISDIREISIDAAAQAHHPTPRWLKLLRGD
jgi:hypothetical protein